MPLSQPQQHMPPLIPPTCPQPLPTESTNPLSALDPLTPTESNNPPPATAPSRRPYPPSATGLEDTCPLPLILPASTPAVSPARKPWRNWPWVVGGIVLLLGIIGIIGGGQKRSTSTVTTAEPQAPAAPPAAPASPANLATAFGDGIYVVGIDIVPGTYATTGVTAGGIGMCSWSRLKDTSGNFDSIIANDAQQGPTTVTITKTDGLFETAGCNTWQEVVSLDPQPAAG
jgi:hypothetical protein